jgi:hypothetical protein
VIALAAQIRDNCQFGTTVDEPAELCPRGLIKVRRPPYTRSIIKGQVCPIDRITVGAWMRTANGIDASPRFADGTQHAPPEVVAGHRSPVGVATTRSSGAT